MKNFKIKNTCQDRHQPNILRSISKVYGFAVSNLELGKVYFVQKHLLIYIATFVLLFGIGAGVFAQTGSYTIIDPPGSIRTEANGINNAGDVVGTYQDTSGIYHGFKFSNGVFISIDPPDFYRTEANGINTAGDVIGTYGDNNNRGRGFKLSNGVFTIINPPGPNGASNNVVTSAYGINTTGDVVGRYRDIDGIQHGFKFSNGIFTIIDVPGSVETYPYAINTAGDVVGIYSDSNNPEVRRVRTFKLSNGVFTIIDLPGSIRTEALAINTAGEVVGYYEHSNGTYHGFKFSGGVFTSIDAPGSVSTEASGINNAGDIAGTYQDTSGIYHGFKLSNGVFTVIDPPGSVSTGVKRINTAGDVVGTYQDTSGRLHGFKFRAVTPLVTNVQRTYSGFFLAGFNQSNTFNVGVNWQGSPGQVKFQVNNDAPVTVQGNAAGAVQPFNLATSFTPSYSSSVIKITPINGEGIVGETRTENIYIFPHPPWLSDALSEFGSDALRFTAANGEIRADFKATYPKPEFKATVRIPEEVPYIGGDLGISKAQGTFTGFVSSIGNGSLTLQGQTRFKGLEQELFGSATGTGNFLLNENGLSVNNASLNLNLEATFRKNVSLITAIPALAPFRRYEAIRRFTDTTRLTGELKPSLGFSTTWRQDVATRQLVFNEATGTIGLNMRAGLSNKIDRFRFQGWVAGGGSMTIGTPSPFVRNFSLNFEVGAKVSIDGLYEFPPATINYGCTWTAATEQTVCASTSLNGLLNGDNNFNPRLKLIRYRYEKFGKYEYLKPSTQKIDSASISGDSQTSFSSADTTIISNVFGNAEPKILPVGNNGKMILYVRQNPSLPILQSTDIAWSFNDGNGWSAPNPIFSDTRAEFSPVVGVDPSGNVIAAWLRIKVQNFTTPIPTADDLPLYYKQVEVISSVFNPTTRTWSAETVLTDDLALDTSLRLAKDEGGKLLLTWQSNPNGEFSANAANPATLKYSFWNGSSWNAPAVVANNLINISEHAVAVKGNNAFIILPIDPDVNVINDGKLILFSWNGSAWSQGTEFAGGSVNNQLPTAVYSPASEGQIVWLKGTDLVQAKLNNPVPQIVRQGSESTGFHNIQLLNNSQNNLTLIWQDVVDNGSANIFSKIYNPITNSWGNDNRLNQDDQQSKDVSGYYDNNGNLQLAYLATQILRVTKNVTINGQTYQIPNVPENGQTDLRLLTINQAKAAFDFDGDGKADISVFRPDNGTWYLLQSQAGFTGLAFGLGTDKLAPADFDGDGKTDIAVVRNGIWYLQRSQLGFTGIQFGDGNDIPVPADYDGDGKAELAVFRPSNGYWYLLNLTTNQFTATPFGQSGDKPVAADYDGDGKADIAVNRNGNWYLNRSQLGFTGILFGDSNDKTVPADYDGDGKADIAVFRPSNGTWYLLQSTAGFTGLAFGLETDIPVAADYDGDGKADIAVVRNGNWYLNRTTQGFTGILFGTSTDKPVPNSFVR